MRKLIAVITGMGLALLTTAIAHSQTSLPTAPAPQIDTLYAGGVTYNPGGSPQIAGNGLYAHSITGTSTYAFVDVDAMPVSVKPFRVTTNVGVGVAERIFTLGSVPVFAPTAAGVEWNGTNTGWQWNGGLMAAIRYKKTNYYFLPHVRFLKGSVTDGSGYQVMAGVDFGFGVPKVVN